MFSNITHIPSHQNARLMWSIVLCTTTCPITRTSWFSSIILCRMDCSTTINSWSCSTWYKIPWGDILNFCHSIFCGVNAANYFTSLSFLWASLIWLISYFSNVIFIAWTTLAWSLSWFFVQLLPLSWPPFFYGRLLLKASTMMLVFPGWYLTFGWID